MTTETTTTLPPADVLDAVRHFFMGGDAYHEAWLETESESHLSFGTFRGNLAVAAFPDPAGEAPTRVRITTLREEGVVPRLLTYLQTLDREASGAVAVAAAEQLEPGHGAPPPPTDAPAPREGDGGSAAGADRD